MSDRERGKLEWAELKVIEDTHTGMAVRLQVGQGVGRPQYSFEFGRMREGKFLRFQRMQYDAVNGQVTVDHGVDFDVLRLLIEQATELVRQTQQAREEEFQSRRQSNKGDGGGGNKGSKSKRRIGTHGRYEEGY